MNGNAQPNFLYLNRDNAWLDFQTRALELGDDGALTLAGLPIFEGALPASLASLQTPTGPAGVAVADEGTVYFTDPDTHRILRIAPCCVEPASQECIPPPRPAPEPCADALPPERIVSPQSDCNAAPVVCVGGAGSQPTRLLEPRGILLHKKRRALVVADSGNHRLQLFDPESFQLVGIWGQANPTGMPEAGDAPGLLDTPWTLAQDDDGNLYVVDYGNQRVQKFDVRGKVISSFWDNVASTKPQDPPLSKPSDIAVVQGHVLVVDASQHTIFVFDPDGNYQRAFGTDELSAPMGIAGNSQAIYVGDNSARRILVFKPDGTWLSAARGYQGTVSALAPDARNGLWVHPGGDTPFALMRKGAHVQQGRLWGGPFQNPSPHPDQWHQLTAKVELPTDAHIQFFVYTTSQNTAPNEPWNSPVVDLGQEQTRRYLTDSSQDKWLRVPLDVTAFLIPGQAFENVWVAAELTSEGLSTPALEQLRLELDHQSYAEYLPTIYRAGMQIPGQSTATDQDAIDRQAAKTRQFLTRFLSLFQSEYTDLENLIAGMTGLFDAAAVPVEFLDWLASWLALELDAARPEWERRQLLADAFALYAKRGTVEGLRLALQRFAQVDAQIQEPLQQISWWALPTDESSPLLDTATSVLGFTTMLAPSEPQGAVVGTTAILDASHLITQEEYGAPLFSEFAHQFSVRIYRGATYSAPKAAQLRALIEREKPAHVLYNLCVVEPQMRVGFQAQVGIDTIVAGPPPPSNLGQGAIVLGGEMPGRVGEQSRIGQTTRLVR